MKSIFAMAFKDLRLLLRDRAGFFFVFFLPLIYGVFFGLMFSGQGGNTQPLSIAVVDEDDTENSRKFVEKLVASDEVAVTRTNRDEAVSLVRRGKRVAYLILPEGFGDSRSRIFQGEPIRMDVGLDPARKAESGMIQGILIRHAFSILMDLFQDREAMRDQARAGIESIDRSTDIKPITAAVVKHFLQAVDRYMTDLPEEEAGEEGGSPGFGDWQPIKINFQGVSVAWEGPKTSFDITFPQSIIWLLLGCSAAFGVSLVMERTRGTLIRLRSAPISFTQILAGKGLACFLTIMAASVLLFAFFALVFGVRPDSYPFLVLAILSSALAFVGIMMLIAVMGKTEASAGGIGWSVNLIMALIGGGMIPLFFMPAWMQSLSNFSFVKWTIIAVEGAVWRGFTLTEMAFPCGILLAIGLVTFTTGVFLFRRTV